MYTKRKQKYTCKRSIMKTIMKENHYLCNDFYYLLIIWNMYILCTKVHREMFWPSSLIRRQWFVSAIISFSQSVQSFSYFRRRWDSELAFIEMKESSKVQWNLRTGFVRNFTRLGIQPIHRSSIPIPIVFAF